MGVLVDNYHGRIHREIIKLSYRKQGNHDTGSHVNDEMSVSSLTNQERKSI